MKSIEEIRALFAEDRFATGLCMQVDDVNDERVVCSMALQPLHNNARGGVQGGAIFTLADFAFAVATNAGGRDVVTLNSTIHYLRAPKGEKLIAATTCIQAGRTIGLYRVDITDDTGTLVAQVDTTGYCRG